MAHDLFVKASKRPTISCGYATMRDRLDNDQQQQLDEAAAEPVTVVTHAGIRKVLTDVWGYDNVPSATIIGYHRRGGCSCDV